VRNSLIRDGFEMAWCIDEFLSDLVRELDGSDEVADAEAEAHFGKVNIWNVVDMRR
jgi:hypothetical protein